MPPKIAFISADETGKTTAKDRKLIRSHCMLGKNQRKYPYQGDKYYRDGKKKRTTNPKPDNPSTVVVSIPTSTVTEYRAPLSGETHSVFSNASFARDLDGFSRHLLYRYFFVARDVFYPIQFCTYSDKSMLTWFKWLFDDTAYLESVLMGMSAMDDFFNGRSQPSKLTLSHLKATITTLNRRLSDPELSLADSTVAVVMGLADLSGFLYDDAAAKAHVSGFQKMVRLRGGVGGFGENAKLQIKIGRFDLSYALKTGKPPQFYMDTISWSPIFEPPEQSASPVSFITSPKLLVIFHDLIQFTAILNASCSISSDSSPKPVLMDTQYLKTICSIQYRLLCLENELVTIVDEAVRLGMLALLTTTFQVAGQRARYPHLEERFRTFCKALPPASIDITSGSTAVQEFPGGDGQEQGMPVIPPEVVLWLLIVGGLAVFNVLEAQGGKGLGGTNVVDDKPWMVETFHRHLLGECWRDWEQVEKKLKKFPWVEVIHDQPAKAIFQALFTGAREMDGGINSS